MKIDRELQTILEGLIDPFNCMDKPGFEELEIKKAIKAIKKLFKHENKKR